MRISADSGPKLRYNHWGATDHSCDHGPLTPRNEAARLLLARTGRTVRNPGTTVETFLSTGASSVALSCFGSWTDIVFPAADPAFLCARKRKAAEICSRNRWHGGSGAAR
jgi:hypothetical protein